MAKKNWSMNERINAFYKQSGGPNNDKIPELLEKHLLYGKDHGMPGYKENFEDAVIDTMVSDQSLLLLFQRIQRWRIKDSQESSLENRIKSLEEEVSKLRKEIVSMK